MKCLTKRLALLVAVVLLAGATLVSLPAGAGAAEWFVGGASLGGSSELQSAKLTKPIVFAIPAVKLKIECPSAKFNKLVIFSANQSTAESINFEECTVLEPAGCKLVQREIKTEEIMLVPGTGSGGSGTFEKLAVHGSFIVVSLSEGCGSLSHTNVPVKGKVTTFAPTLQTEKPEQSVEFEGEKSKGLTAEIEKKEDPVYITGAFAEKTKSGKEWSFH